MVLHEESEDGVVVLVAGEDGGLLQAGLATAFQHELQKKLKRLSSVLAGVDRGQHRGLADTPQHRCQTEITTKV